MNLGFWSCNNETVNSTEKKSVDSLQDMSSIDTNVNIGFYKTDCEEIEINKKFHVRPYSNNLRVFVESCPVYCSPNERSEIVDTLKFNTEVRLIEIIENKSIVWYRISNLERSLFVKKEHLALYPGNAGYLVGYSLNDKEQIVELKSILSDKSDKVVANYSFLKNYSKFKLENLPYNGLDKSGLIIKYTTIHSIDPTVYYYEYVIFNQDKRTFKKLVSYSSEYIDVCESEEEIYYFPMKFGNGKILLVKDADFEHIFDYQTAELNTLEYPKQTNIPIGQLIIKISKMTVCVTDEDGSQIIDPKTENPKEKITERKPVYYRWDGEKLTAE